LNLLFVDQFGVSAGHGGEGCSAFPASEATSARGPREVVDLRMRRPQARFGCGTGWCELTRGVTAPGRLLGYGRRVLLLVVTGQDVAGVGSRAVGERGFADLAAHRRHRGHHDGKGPASRPAARSRMRWHSHHPLRARPRGRVSDAHARALRPRPRSSGPPTPTGRWLAARVRLSGRHGWIHPTLPN
jgi:hypothetical protein